MPLKAGQAKAKGNSFENKIAKDLSLWITKGARADVFDRSPASGAKATLHYYKKNSELFANQTGDIVALDDAGYVLTNEFIIECKHYRDLQLLGCLFGTPKSGLLTFWEKVQKEAARVEKQPLLVARQNFRPIICCTTTLGLQKLNLSKQQTSAFYPKLHMVVMLWSDFLEHAHV